jgi:hypothetical protein
LYVLDYLADPSCARRPGQGLCAEYRLLCSGSIHRRVIGEWHKSEGARFLLAPPLLLYAASRPFYEYPLELALHLTVAQVEETQQSRSGGTLMSTFHPDEEVARDLTALLTVLCRRLITVIGKSAERFTSNEYSTQRVAGYEYPEFDRIPLPVADMRRVYWPPHPVSVITGRDWQKVRDNNPPPKPVDPDALTAILLALPQLKHAEAIIASARLYALALELIHEQPDIAYQLLVSSVETIAKTALIDFQPDDDAKVDYRRPVFNLAKELGLGEDAARKLALEACKEDRWVSRKFKKFLTDNLDASVWDSPDDLFGAPPPEYLPRREGFQKTLDHIYGARSAATHSGQQFPLSASYSGRPTVRWQVMYAFLGSDSAFPPVVWFERIVNMAIRTFWERSVGALSDTGSTDSD